MGNIVLLEQEEDIRLAAVIVARNRGITLKVYRDFGEYKDNIQEKEIVFSSDLAECKENQFIYIKKPYTANELMQAINQELK